MSICRFVVLSITSLRCIQAFSIPTLCILAEIWWCRKDRLMFSFASEPKTTKRWCLNPSCCWFQSQPLSLQQRHRIFPRDIINLAVMQLCYIETHETSLDFLSASLTYCQNVWDIMIQTHTHLIRHADRNLTINCCFWKRVFSDICHLADPGSLGACDFKDKFWGWSN